MGTRATGSFCRHQRQQRDRLIQASNHTCAWQQKPCQHTTETGMHCSRIEQRPMLHAACCLVHIAEQRFMSPSIPLAFECIWQPATELQYSTASRILLQRLTLLTIRNVRSFSLYSVSYLQDSSSCICSCVTRGNMCLQHRADNIKVRLAAAACIQAHHTKAVQSTAAPAKHSNYPWLQQTRTLPMFKFTVRTNHFHIHQAVSITPQCTPPQPR